ncbi:MAG: hypothetical protein K8R59_16785 [Thermoanaerobaculales bacterium]|nr:hypothetical protein [Thermoanaerobaculales bacterium]
METHSTRFHLILLGAVATAAQALLLREAMTTLRGSELAWGALLFLWLAGAAGGARFSAGGKPRTWVERWSTFAIASGAAWGFVALRAAPALAGGSGGETANAWLVLLVWPIAVLPAAVATGAGFSFLAGRLGEAASAYGLESLGAALGGLAFTFILAPLGGSFMISILVGLGVTVLLPPRSWFLSLLLLATAFTIGLAAKPWVASATWAAGRHQGDLAASEESRHQRLEISSGPPHSVYADGRLTGTFPPDPFLERPSAEFLLLLHPDAHRVAVIGGLSDGRIGALLGPSIEQLFIIEEDRALIRLLASGLSPATTATLNDARVGLISTAPLRALNQLRDIDLFLLLDGPPTNLRANRTRTLEFLQSIPSCLSEQGLLVMSTGTDDTYLGGIAGRLLAIQATTLKSVFPQVFAVAGNPVLLLAARDRSAEFPFAEDLVERWRRRGPDRVEYLDLMVPTLLNASRSSELMHALEDHNAPVNTAGRPTAVLAAATLTEGRSLHVLLPMFGALMDAPRWPAALALAAALLLFGGSGFVRLKQRTAPALIVGFVGMTWWLLLLAAWQATRGSVYSEVGLLSALFMGGLAAGSFSASFRPSSFTLSRLLTAGFGLSGAMFFGITLVLPEITIPSFLLFGGGIIGAAFPSLAALSGGSRNRRGIAIAFAADEMGAAGAAFLVGIIGIPWLGSNAVAAGTALLCLAGIVAAGPIHLNTR